MKTLQLAFKNWKYKPWQSLPIMLLVFFSILLASGVYTLKINAENGFKKSLFPIDLVAGAKGSSLQLLLNAVYQLDDPVGNINLVDFEKLKKNPLIKEAVPICLGDAYQGFPIIGTNQSYFRLYELKAAKGVLELKSNQIVIGNAAQTSTGLNIGDTIFTTHGSGNEGHQHEHPMIIAGVLPPTGLPVDKALITNMKNIWASHHETENLQITAALLQTRSPIAKVQLPGQYNRGTLLQLTLPSVELNKLRYFTDGLVKAIQWLIVILSFVSLLGVAFIMLQKVQNRMKEYWLLYSMGWKKGAIISTLAFECLFLITIPAILALITAKVMLLSTSIYWVEQYGVLIENLFSLNDILLIGISVLVGLVVSIIPVIKVLTSNKFLNQSV